MAKRFLDIGLADTTPHPLNLEIDSAEGVWLKTVDGRKIFDAICGVGVSSFGHGNKVITDLLHTQVDSCLHTMVYGEFINKRTAEAGELLSSLLPDQLNTTYFVNSGAEAVEGALKLAKKHTGRRKFVAFNGGYHGNTSGALSVSSNAERKAPFMPLLEGVDFLEFNGSLFQIDDSYAGVIVETVQGDAGVRIPDKAWLQELRAKCDEAGVVLIFDEVQCGIGRTGKAFAFEHYGVVPDILCLGKALGGGVPIGAFVSSREMMEGLSDNPKLGHITTFGGNPLATSGAVGALRLLTDLDWNRIETQGASWEKQLLAHNSVKTVRRIGLYFYVEMESADVVTETVMKGLDEGVLLFWFLSVPNAFRLSPPLNMSDDEAELGIELILKSLPL